MPTSIFFYQCLTVVQCRSEGTRVKSKGLTQKWQNCEMPKAGPVSNAGIEGNAAKTDKV